MHYSRWAFDIALRTGEKFAQHHVDALLGGFLADRGFFSLSTSFSPIKNKSFTIHS